MILQTSQDMGEKRDIAARSKGRDRNDRLFIYMLLVVRFKRPAFRINTDDADFHDEICYGALPKGSMDQELSFGIYIHAYPFKCLKCGLTANPRKPRAHCMVKIVCTHPFRSSICIPSFHYVTYSVRRIIGSKSGSFRLRLISCRKLSEVRLAPPYENISAPSRPWV
jgi:hypothetical protein